MGSGRTIGEVARDLGVSTWSLGRWIGRAKNGETLSEPEDARPEDGRTARAASAPPGARVCQPAARHFKKSLWHLVGADAPARFTLMETLRDQYPHDAQAQALQVSESGFAAHRRKAQRPRRQKDALLRPLILQSFAQSRDTYGARC